jgi:hypothetical protein
LHRQSFLRRFDLESRLPDDQADSGLDPPETPHARDGGPMDLAGRRLLHPAPPRPPAGHGPPSALGEAEPGRLTPARVRRGFRNLRPNLPCPTRAPKTNRTGPGRPPGSKNQRPAIRYDVGKTVRRPETIAKRDQVGP